MPKQYFSFSKSSVIKTYGKIATVNVLLCSFLYSTVPILPDKGRSKSFFAPVHFHPGLQLPISFFERVS